MSSYGSMSPTDEGFDRYEQPYYCHAHGTQGSPLDAAMYWQGGETQDFEVTDYDSANYISRSYGYDDMIPSGDTFDGYHQQQLHATYTHSMPACGVPSATPVRAVRRRHTANRKERRRTQSINTAFADLRDCIPNVPADTKLSKSQKKERKQTVSINNAFTDLRGRIPNVPADTKLSKIKTLRLATSYIAYLMRVLAGGGDAGGFRAELTPAPRRARHDALPAATTAEVKRGKGRTGWPQHVWALELNNEQNLQA